MHCGNICYNTAALFRQCNSGQKFGLWNDLPQSMHRITALGHQCNTIFSNHRGLYIWTRILWIEREMKSNGWELHVERERVSWLLNKRVPTNSTKPAKNWFTVCITILTNNQACNSQTWSVFIPDLYISKMNHKSSKQLDYRRRLKSDVEPKPTICG